MKNKINLFAILSLFTATLLMTSSCGIIKKASATPVPGSGQTTPDTSTTSSSDPLDAVIATLGDWQTLQTGGDIKLKAGSDFSSSIQVRMVRDKDIYISLRPMLGIEVGKLLITGDSIFVVDKLHKRYIAEKVSLLTAGIPVTVSDVQDIFLGRAFIIGKGTLCESMKGLVTASKAGSNVTVTANEHYKGYSYYFTYDKSSHIVSLNIVPEGSTQSAYQVQYGDVSATKAGNIAHSIKFNAVIEKKKIEFDLSYKKIDWNGNVKIDHDLPRNYTRMSAKDLFSMFSN